MPYSNEEERRDFVRESSLGWAARTHVCNVAYERHDPELRRKIRYEDLLADTEANFTDLASWLGLPGGPKRIENIVKAHSFERVPRTAGAREDPPDGDAGRLARGPEPRGPGGRPGDHGRGPGHARLRDMSSDVAPAYDATAGLPFDDEELESKLVWIWGSPRTGSTWLLEMLCYPLESKRAEPLGFSWPEGFAVRFRPSPVDEFLISSHLAPHQEAGSSTIFGTPVSRNPTGLFAAGPATRSPASSRTSGDPRRAPHARPPARRRRARPRSRPRASRRTCPLLVIKEVNGSHAPISSCRSFPGRKMIFMVRDGRDIVDSLLDANSQGGWLTRPASERAASIPTRSDSSGCARPAAPGRADQRVLRGHTRRTTRRLRQEDPLRGPARRPDVSRN